MELVSVCHPYVLAPDILPFVYLYKLYLPLGTVICFCIPVILLLEEHAYPYCVQQYVMISVILLLEHILPLCIAICFCIPVIPLLWTGRCLCISVIPLLDNTLPV